jgi:hypothetical protein
LSPKYYLVKAVFGWQAAKNVAILMRKIRWSSMKLFDKALFRIESRQTSRTAPKLEEPTAANHPHSRPT